MLRRYLHGAMRRSGTWPLRLVGNKLRAEILENESEKMIELAQIPAGAIYFYAPSPLLQSRAQSLLSKEPETIAWIDSFKKDAVFWDVGANVGIYSLYGAIAHNLNVVAFEPSAANFYVLSRNIFLNGLGDRIQGYCIALSKETGLGVLNLESVSMGAAVNQFGKPGELSRYSEKANAATVHGMVGFSIDDFISRFAVKFPNHIKMDVDGLELDILHGAKNTLQDHRLLSIMVELSVTDKDQFPGAVDALTKAGFELVLKGDLQGTASDCAANHLFQRR